MVKVYLAQPFWVQQGRFVPGSVYQFDGEEEALRRAERLSIKNAGVAVYEQEVEPDVGPVGLPRLIARHGSLPRLAY